MLKTYIKGKDYHFCEWEDLTLQIFLKHSVLTPIEILKDIYRN